MSYSDFELPGLSNNPNGLASLTVALAFAYSRRWNRRRLEHHTYAFWDQVLSYLIYDLQPYLFHVPQLLIHNPPKEYPDLSIRTDPGANGDENIPDFSILGVNAMHRYKKSSREEPHFPALENWDMLTINSVKPFLIAELKRTAPRSANSVPEFRKKLGALMRLAMEGVEDQARLAFGVSLYGKDFKTVILIAACGEWWRFRVATKAGLGIKFDVLKILDEDDEADDDKVAYEDPSQGGTKTTGPRVSLVRRYTNIGPDDIVVLKGNVEDAMPETDEWSGNILFGTKASNQCLFLIHRWLKEQRGDVGVPYPDSSEESSEDELDTLDTDS